MFPAAVTASRLKFQSTPPARGATISGWSLAKRLLSFQSTPPARGATKRYKVLTDMIKISIHAPREGGDLWLP